MVVNNPDEPAPKPLGQRGLARAGGDAVRHGARRAGDAAAEGPVHPAAGAGSLPRCLRGSARSAAVHDPPAEPRHPRHPDRRHHQAVHGVHHSHGRPAARARRRIPGDGRDAGGDQVAHAAAARGRSECRRGERSARRPGAPPAGIRALQERRGKHRPHPAHRARHLGRQRRARRAQVVAAAAAGRDAGDAAGVPRRGAALRDVRPPSRAARAAVGAGTHV